MVEWQVEGAEDLPDFAKLVKVTAPYAFNCTCFHVAEIGSKQRLIRRRHDI